MKIILDNSSEKTIGINEITEEYLVVAIIKNQPCILSKGWNENMENLTFFQLTDDFLNGNGFDYGEDVDTIEKSIKEAINTHDSKVEAFHQDNWKEALQWLINNAE